MSFIADCAPTFAERALAKHREKVRDVLVDMFEKPIPESEAVSREIASRVLGMSVDFSKPILDIATNPHLQDLARPGVPPLVWESKERRKGTNARTVLDPIAVAGQEPLLDFLGESRYDNIL